MVTEDMESFDVLTPEMINVKFMNRMDRDALFPGSISDVSEVVGAVAIETIPAGTILQYDNMMITGDSAQKLIGVDNKVEMQYMIPKELRLVSIGLDAEGSIARLVKKGDIVDLVYTSRDESTGGIYSKTILQQVTVFDVEKYDPDRGLQNQNVLILVRPEDVSMVVAAKRNGIIDLLLNPNGTEQYDDKPFHISAMAPPAASTKKDSLDDLMSIVAKNDYLSPGGKNNILLMLYEEIQAEDIRLAVEESLIPEDKKQKILDILNDQ